MADTVVDRRRIALHEAAHAVIGLDHNLVVNYATICPCEYVSGARSVTGCAEWSLTESLGHVMVKWPGPDADLEGYLLMMLAGAAAERKAFGNSVYDGQDIKTARQIVWVDTMDVTKLWLKETDIDAAMPAWHAKADRLVDAAWPWIRCVADALEERVGLLSDEVARLRPTA